MVALWSVARDGRGFVLMLTDTSWVFFVVSSTTLVAMVVERKVTGRERGLNRGSGKRKEHDTKSETEERRDEAFQGSTWRVGSSLLNK